MLHVNHSLLQFADITDPLLSTVALLFRFYSHRIQTSAIKTASYLARWILRSHMQYAIEIGCNCNFQFSQSIVETYLRGDGEFYDVLYKTSAGTWQWKNFVNWSTFAEVMIKSKVYCFLTDSIIMLTHGTQLVISTHVFYRKWRTSQGHMHCQAVKSTVSVVIYRKRCKIETLLGLLQWFIMAYGIVAIPMTLSDLQGRSPIRSSFKWDFSYSCEGVNKISTDIARCAVHLR